MSEYQVSLMAKGQKAEVQALMQASFGASLAPIFFIHPETTLVVTYQERVVAGLNIDLYDVNAEVKMGYIGWLYTHPEHRGKGLAGLLLDHAIPFLQRLGCTDLAACVEGDNPASFRQLEGVGFSRLSLRGQLSRFKFGTAKVWRHASRFFDMGYFLYHRRLDDQPVPPIPSGIKALLLTVVANLLIALPILLHLHIPALFGLSLITRAPLLLIAIPLTLLARDGAMALTGRAMGRKTAYYGWDTAYVAGLLVPLLTGLPFPVPGNRYIAEEGWSLRTDARTLSVMAMTSNLSLGVVCFFLPNLYTFILLILDTFFSFYPFCGFNASRLRRHGKTGILVSLFVLLACTIQVLVY